MALSLCFECSLLVINTSDEGSWHFPITLMKGALLKSGLWWSLFEKNDTLWGVSIQSKIITAPPEDSPLIIGLLGYSVNQKRRFVV